MSVEEAVLALRQMWEAESPIRLHERGVEDSELGSPRMTKQFYRYISGHPCETIAEVSQQDCNGDMHEYAGGAKHCPSCVGTGVKRVHREALRTPVRCALAGLWARQEKRRAVRILWAIREARYPTNPSAVGIADADVLWACRALQQSLALTPLGQRRGKSDSQLDAEAKRTPVRYNAA